MKLLAQLALAIVLGISLSNAMDVAIDKHEAQRDENRAEMRSNAVDWETEAKIQALNEKAARIGGRAM